MTNQELFDRVVKHLAAQKKQAVEVGICKYRTHDGCKCAGGCLIDDSHYEPSMEGVAIKDKISLEDQSIWDGNVVGGTEEEFSRQWRLLLLG